VRKEARGAQSSGQRRKKGKNDKLFRVRREAYSPRRSLTCGSEAAEQSLVVIGGGQFW